MPEKKSRFGRLLTFVDLPIQKRFFSFAAGVQFWFLVLAGVGVLFLFLIGARTERLVSRYLPQEQVAQLLSRQLHELGQDAAFIAANSDSSQVEKRSEQARARTRDLYRYLGLLAKGGDLQLPKGGAEGGGTLTVQQLDSSEHNRRFLRELQSGVLGIENTLTTLSRQRAAGVAVDQNQMEVREKVLLSLSALTGQVSDFQGELSQERGRCVDVIDLLIGRAMWVSLTLLCCSSLMLYFFTRALAWSFTSPVHSITEQIKELGEGKIDLDLIQKLDVTQQDEIGVLFHAFNGLMESIKTMSNFKKVIEEDDSVEDVYMRLGAIFSTVIGLDTFRIYEVLEDQCTMRLAYPFGMSANDMYCSPDILDACSQCRAKKTGHTVSSLMYPQVCKHYYTEIPRQHICIPMITGGACCGVVQFLIEAPTSVADLQALDRQLYRAEEFIKESLPVIEAKRLMGTLRESALTDTLTGLSNRRFLEGEADGLVAGALRRNKMLGLIMCDMDFFKQVNDTYGHKSGDEVLVQVSRLIRQSVRDSDLVVRFGGEEFLVLLVDVSHNETAQVAEKIRLNVENATMKISDGPPLKKTVSMGVSEFPSDAQDIWEAIKHADMALYRAKTEGRNRVVSYQADFSAPVS